MYYLAFDPSSKALVYAGKDNSINVGFGTDGVVVWTTLDEEFDPTYNYTYDASTLVASKGSPLDAAEEKRKEDEWKAVQYRDARRSQYPDIGDQLDDLYKKGAFSDEMTAKIKAVKDNYPKPS